MRDNAIRKNAPRAIFLFCSVSFFVWTWLPPVLFPEAFVKLIVAAGLHEWATGESGMLWMLTDGMPWFIPVPIVIGFLAGIAAWRLG